MNTVNQSIASNGHSLFPAAQDAGHSPAAFQLHPSKPMKPLQRISSPRTSLHAKLAVEVETEGVRMKQQSPSALVGGFLRSLLHKEELEQRSSSAAVALAISVVSAVKLERKQMDQIAKKMQKLTGFQHLKLENIVDPALIAGFVISYGSDDASVIDLSVKGQLAQIAERLESSDQRQGWNLPGVV